MGVVLSGRWCLNAPPKHAMLSGQLTPHPSAMSDVLSIESVTVDEKHGTARVIAVIDEAVVTRSATWFDPEEYGPAVCEAVITLDDEDCTDITIDYLESLCPDWFLLP